ncbi:Rossmann-like and DUF2520 domain-containing protein [Spirilliplanes yamanashiensis]|uniref:DUF2520 domain-containing protein n=1 Tax=Spirilliplanes yamanashiensis TaxID=42233 RepID=A0A8J3Y6I5_9ACTN|nr:DUF2520 domain-containing protein [Spirilliplanes yamanashiensis]MDP9814576.1 putative short-subunit dehydrogenase-like oxidoreductase (DUF2520 family) [Spirilliplanes yamanashiensis]GIJ02228.1 hypothetical protein Sya03_15800 [Spirilliplanes yamanashiensis]
MSAPLRVAVLGAGRVGSALGAALAAAGHHVVAASGRAGRAAVLAAEADLLLIAVPDDALDAVVADLAPRAGRAVAHTSGAHGLKDGVGLALHPAMTFTGTPADVARLRGIRWGVTARDRDRDLAARLVADLGGVPEWIADEARPLYHAALAHGANHLVTLVNDAADALRAAGVGDPAAVLRPLLTAALDNVLAVGDRALTGPVARGDAGTVARHLAALPADLTPAYRALARRTAERAGRITTMEAVLA